MIYQPFQHTEPTHVYRTKHWHLLLGCIALLILFAFVGTLFIMADQGELLTSGIISFLLSIVSFGIILRQKLVISPAGISVTYWRTASTPWNNVTGLQLFTMNTLGINDHIHGFVLHQPPLGYQTTLKRAIPEELHGRVLLLVIQNWERVSEIEQDIQQFLPHSMHSGLFVPHSFAALQQHYNKRGFAVALFFLIITIILLIS